MNWKESTVSDTPTTSDGGDGNAPDQVTTVSDTPATPDGTDDYAPDQVTTLSDTPAPSDGGGDTAPDQVTTVTSQSWLGRLRDSVVGSLVGIALVIGAVLLLYWNEGNEVTSFRSLAAVERLVVEAPPARIDPALEGRLVHLTGSVEAARPARDPVFGPAATAAVRLERQVEMFQWQEHSTSSTEKSLGGGSTTQTTYDYQKVWSDRAIDSTPFHARAGHANPPWSLSSLTSDADARLGPYRLDAAVLDHLTPSAPVDLPEGATLPPGWQHGEAGPYRGRDPMAPAVGDLRVSFRAVLPGTASVIAGQQGNRLAAFAVPDGSTVALATPGSASAQAMIAAERSAARTLAWVLRLVGFLLCLVGLVMLVRPLAVLVSVIPVLETVVDVTATVVMAGFATLITLVTIAVARIVYQPLLSLGLLAAGLAITAGCIWLRRRGSTAVPRAG